GPLLAGPYEVFGGAGRVVGRLGAAVALPQWWGARADGKHDDATAINRAIQAMSEAGGGTVHLPAGTYLLGTVTPSRVPKEPRFATLIVPKSRVNIDGEGDVTVLRAADGLSQNRQWNFIYPPDAGRGDPLTDVTYGHFKVDGNGENNLRMARARWNAIGTNFGARITIDSLTFVNNASRQCLRFGNNAMPHTVRDLTIRNCRFDTVGGAIQGNDGQTDHSSIYAQADGCLIQDNVFTQPDLDRTNASTAIEVHASNAIVSGNYIRNYRGGINVVASVTDQINVIYTDNVIVGCEGSGFKFWCNEHVMDRVRITRNTVEQHGPLPGHPKREQAAVAPMIGMGVRTPIRSIMIEGNNLSYVGEREAPDDLNIGYGISIGRCRDLRIIGNRITGTLRSALAHDGTITPLTDDLQRIEILDNQITDCCRATNARDTARTAILLTHNPRQRARTLRFLRVERNSIVNSGDEPTMQRGVYCTLGLADGAITSNFVIGASTDLAWDGASRVHRLHVEHAGVGSPEGVVRASAGSRYTNRDTGDAWDKVEGDTSANGWALRAHGVKAPTAGSHKLGDIVYNRAPKPGAPTGWVCVKAGEPGSFAAFGHIES
ncbi:MAG: glycosyl hydrolase family 28-related protein, partial [Vicinamibacteraceae bacterium]